MVLGVYLWMYHRPQSHNSHSFTPFLPHKNSMTRLFSPITTLTPRLAIVSNLTPPPSLTPLPTTIPYYRAPTSTPNSTIWWPTATGLWFTRFPGTPSYSTLSTRTSCILYSPPWYMNPFTTSPSMYLHSHSQQRGNHPASFIMPCNSCQHDRKALC